MSGGRSNVGRVVRIGATIRRPRGAGAETVEELLVHLQRVGFAEAPRFLGIDDEGRQILDYVEGDVYRQPPWQLDDDTNAAQLGSLARLVRRLHDATREFHPSTGAEPGRPLPIPGPTWTHGDPGYPNVVYRNDVAAALIDWEFAGPADPVCDPAALLALAVRGPRPDVDDNARRARAVKLALSAIAAGYDMADEIRRGLPQAAAAVLDDTATHWRSDGADPSDVERLEWRATWFRVNTELLLS